MFNVTATDGSGAGNIAAYASGIPYPGNSSVHLAPGRNVANLVICAMNASGENDLRAGFSPTHAIVDPVGSIF